MCENKKIFVLVVLLFFAFGYMFSYKIDTSFVNKKCSSNLDLLNPNIDCDTSDSKIENLSTLQERLEVLVGGYTKSRKAQRVSVFVRDLNTARFAGVNDNDVFYMASLLKTPLMIGGFKLAEVEPKVMDQEIVYTGKPDLYSEQIIKSGEHLKVGDSYTIRELIRRSVVHSDNTAAQILFDYYPQDFMDRIMQAIGLQLTKSTGEQENLVTARTYAGVFRTLYNASYLTNEFSNEALKILTQTEFKEGAVAQLPKGVIVAHKFAERTYNDSKTGVLLRQLHECGIVYAKEPYTFCIMTEGGDYKDLEKIISDISLIVYEEIVKE